VPHKSFRQYKDTKAEDRKQKTKSYILNLNCLTSSDFLSRGQIKKPRKLFGLLAIF
jgi:hypothetical protein